MTNKNKIIGVAIILYIMYSQIQIFNLQNQIKELSCDLRYSFYAEREYTYPILREIGYNPDDYGKGINNPLFGYKYQDSCFNR